MPTYIPGLPPDFQANLPVTGTMTTLRPAWVPQIGIPPKTVNGR